MPRSPYQQRYLTEASSEEALQVVGFLRAIVGSDYTEQRVGTVAGWQYIFVPKDRALWGRYVYQIEYFEPSRTPDKKLASKIRVDLKAKPSFGTHRKLRKEVGTVEQAVELIKKFFASL